MSRVDLPEPLGPKSATNSPGSTASETLSSALNAPYDFETFETLTPALRLPTGASETSRTKSMRLVIIMFRHQFRRSCEEYESIARRQHQSPGLCRSPPGRERRCTCGTPCPSRDAKWLSVRTICTDR